MTDTQTETTLTINQVADLFNRLDYARQHQGWTAYEGDRNYNKVLGYPEDIDITDYYARYKRQSLAGRIVDLPAIDTWAKPPKISEDDNEDTPFVKAWKVLVKDRHVWSTLSRADRLSGIGEFGIILVGAKSDGGLETPLKQNELKSPKDILYLRPFSEMSVEVGKTDDDKNSERYGQPLTYKVKLVGDTNTSTEIHYTRTIHLADGKLDNEVYGTPRLEGVWNDLLDMVKFVGGTAEATWLNMRPGTAISTKDKYKLDKSDAAKTARIEEAKRFQHDVLRFLRLDGQEPISMGQGIVMDPEPPFAVTLSLISGKTGIPQRKLVGSAQGQLASAKEDTRQWAGTIAGRQQSYAEPEVLRPFIDWLIWSGAIPAPGQGSYDVGTLDDAGNERTWPSIIEQTDEERATISRSRSTAAKQLVSPGGKLPINLNEQREILGFPPVEPGEMDEEAQTIGEMAAQVAANALSGKIELDQALYWFAETIEDYAAVEQGDLNAVQVIPAPD